MKCIQNKKKLNFVTLPTILQNRVQATDLLKHENFEHLSLGGSLEKMSNMFDRNCHA